MAEDPKDPRRVALASRGDGLWLSSDSGKTWTLARKGAYGVVAAVAFGADGSLLAHFPEEGLVLVRSGRAGQPSGLASAQVYCLVPRADGGWFAGLAHDGVREIDASGQPGGYVNAGLDATRILTLATGEGRDDAWCGDSNGAFFTPDGGTTWQTRDEGLLTAPANLLRWHRQRLYLGSGGQGVFRWIADQAAWEDRSGGMGTANTIFAFDEDSEQDRLYVGTEGGVLRSDDEGGSWVRKNAGLPGASSWVVASSRVTAGKLWAAGGGGLFESTDAGDSWARVADSSAVALLAERTASGERLWTLEPGGLSFRVGGRTEIVSIPLRPQERLLTLALESDRLWVGSTLGLWSVTAGGSVLVWEKAGVLSVLPRGGRVLVGTEGRGVMVLNLP